MKDLYTFDATLQAAEHSYSDAKAAYCRIFDAIGLPYRVVSHRTDLYYAGPLSDASHVDTHRLLQTQATSEVVHRTNSTTSLQVRLTDNNVEPCAFKMRCSRECVPQPVRTL